MNQKPNVRIAIAAGLICVAGLAHGAGFDSNLVVNGGAESGVTGWSTFGGVSPFESAEYGSNWVLPTQPGPVDRGAHLFVGGSVSYAAGYQVLDLTGISAQALASGQVGYTLSGWLGGWLVQADNVKVTAQFFDASSTLLGSAALGPTTPADRGGQTGLTFFTAGGTVPLNTAAISVVMEMTRLEGGDNDGYADNLSFVLSPVPEPASLALALAGMALIGARVVRRQSR